MADIQHLTTTLRGELRRNEPMAKHTSWKCGGAAKQAYIPADLDDLRMFLAQLPLDEKIYFVGLGSNLLVRDGGLDATVILTHGKLNHFGLETIEGETLVAAEAGVAAPKIARFAARHNLSGAEFLAGIPGTIGGALAMNAGCYDAETWTFVKHVTTIDRHGNFYHRTPADYEIGYRHVASRHSSNEEWFVAAQFVFPAGDEATARSKINELLKRRIATQPLAWPNAGSTFANPENDRAGRLIEKAGLKGIKFGGVQISPKHANFIINLGEAANPASAAAIETLITHMHDRVLEKFGVDLRQEVRIVGEVREGVKSEG